MHHEDFERKKQGKEFEELKRRNQEWLDRYLDEVAELLIDLWAVNQDYQIGDDPGSSLTGSRAPENL